MSRLDTLFFAPFHESCLFYCLKFYYGTSIQEVSIKTKFINAFMISRRLSKLKKLDNRARTLIFWLVVSQDLLTFLLYSFSPNKNFLFLVISRRWPFQCFLSWHFHLTIKEFHLPLLQVFQLQVFQIFAARIWCSITSVTCYVNWFNSKKISHACEYWEGMDLVLNFGICQKVFFRMCSIRYQSS